MSDISHKGKIVEITPEFTTVEIVSESACSSCHAKGLCGVSESRRKAVQLPTRGWDNFHVGDEVVLVLKSSMGHKAVWMAYVIPLAILLISLLGLLSFGIGELASSGIAFALVAIWYFVLWLLRNKLKTEYIFNIKR